MTVLRTKNLRSFELIDDRYDSLHQVSDYAQLLNVSPGHLNDIVRQHTGRTATSLIHQRIALEGKDFSSTQTYP